MIEQFTDEQINILRKEIQELDESKKAKEKPYQVYHDAVYEIFKDYPFPKHEKVKTDPYGRDVSSEILVHICRIADMTFGLTSIKDESNSYETADGGKRISHTMHLRTPSRIPPDYYKEYCEMWEEIIEIIKKHIKPYNL